MVSKPLKSEDEATQLSKLVINLLSGSSDKAEAKEAKNILKSTLSSAATLIPAGKDTFTVVSEKLSACVKKVAAGTAKAEVTTDQPISDANGDPLAKPVVSIPVS